MQINNCQASYNPAITSSSAPSTARHNQSGDLSEATEICQDYCHQSSSTHDRPCMENPGTGGHEVYAAASASPLCGSSQETSHDDLNASASMHLLDSGDLMHLDARNTTGASIYIVQLLIAKTYMFVDVDESTLLDIRLYF